MTQKYLFDFSLGVVNRTGAYMIVRDVLDQMPQFFSDVRFWRLLQRDPPDGLARKLLARAMMWEMRLLGDGEALQWPEGRAEPGRRRAFFDPLYVLRSKLDREDIVQCHDVGPVSHPELFPKEVVRLYRMAYEKIRRVGPGMVLISDTTRREFSALFGENYRFMQVIPQYVRLGVLQGETDPVPGVSGRYLLTVGALERRKNYERVMKAYAQSGLRERGVSYVFCGARGLDSVAIIAQAHATPGVHYTGYVSENQLRWLYKNAEGFVLPSLLEGFGLPTLEAAARGLVSVVSQGGVQEESTDGGAVLVDPLSVQSIADGMVRLVDMPAAERQALLDRVQAYARKLNYDAFIECWRLLLERNDRFPDSDGWGASVLARRAI